MNNQYNYAAHYYVQNIMTCKTVPIWIIFKCYILVIQISFAQTGAHLWMSLNCTIYVYFRRRLVIVLVFL